MTPHPRTFRVRRVLVPCRCWRGPHPVWRVFSVNRAGETARAGDYSTWRGAMDAAQRMLRAENIYGMDR
jgi:hypothetical protein